jgi:potassium efflux system protein
MTRVFRRGGWIAWHAAAAILVAFPLWAQEAPPDSAAQAPRPVSVEQISERAPADVVALNAQRARLPGDSTLRVLATALDTIRTEVDSASAAVTAEQLKGLSYEDLQDLERRWGRLRRMLGQWRDQATTVVDRVEGVRDSATTVRAAWQPVLQQSRTAVPAPLRQQVRGVLATADSVTRAVVPIRDSLLSLQTIASQIDVTIAGRMEALGTAQAQARRQLFRRDAAPLWGLLFRSAAEKAAADTSASALEPRAAKVRPAVEYLRDHPGHIQLHLALLAILVLAFWALARQRSRWATADYSMHWPSELLMHPVAAAVLVAGALTHAFYPGAPQGVFGLSFLLVAPALAILLRPILDRSLRAPAYVLLLLVAVQVAADTFLSGVVRGRLALLAITVAGALTCEWFARLAATQRSGDGRRFQSRVEVRLAHAGTALLLIAAAANLLGFLELARLLTAGTLKSGLAALAADALVGIVAGAALVVLLATPAGRLHVIRENRATLTRRVTRLVVAAGVFVWIWLTLGFFRVLQPTLARVEAVLTASVTLGSWHFTAGGILVFFALFVATILVAGAVRVVLRQDVLARVSLGRGVPEAVSSLAYYFVLALGVVFAAGAAGMNFNRLALIAGALGVGIGFGLQSIVANFISGLILLIERPVQSGDTVEFDQLRGTVQSIGIRASIVRTFQGADVIVPNQDFITGRFINWTLSDQTRRVDVPVGVAYGSNPERVLALLTDTVTRQARVNRDPAPSVLFTGFGDSSLDFMVRFWTAADTWLEAQSDVLVAVNRALADAGIEIPFPQRDLHVRSVSPGILDRTRPPRED